jgi:hypothetical protein
MVYVSGLCVSGLCSIIGSTCVGGITFRSAGNCFRLFDLYLPSLLLLELARLVVSFTLTSEITLLALEGCSAFLFCHIPPSSIFWRIEGVCLLSHSGLHLPLAVELEALSLSTRSINVDILII